MTGHDILIFRNDDPSIVALVSICRSSRALAYPTKLEADLRLLYTFINPVLRLGVETTEARLVFAAQGPRLCGMDIKLT